MPRSFGGERHRPVGTGLAGLRFDELLGELQDRLTEIGKTRDRLEGLLDAVVIRTSIFDLHTSGDEATTSRRRRMLDLVAEVGAPPARQRCVARSGLLNLERRAQETRR